MRIINIIINMDHIRHERPYEGPILTLNKRLKYGLSSLEKINNIAFVEVKLLAEIPFKE